MKILVIFLTLITVSSVIQSQEIPVTGTLKDVEGMPMVGANVVIKGTTKGVVADLNGFYSIEAPIGAILVISYIGYLPVELIVTEDGKAVPVKKRSLKSAKPQPATYTAPIIHPYISERIHFKTDTTQFFSHDPENGVAILNNNNAYRINKPKGPIDYRKLEYIATRKQRNKELLIFETGKTKHYYKPTITIHSAYGFEKLLKTPEFQSAFSQGTHMDGNLVWQGPESGQIFTWGPSLANLEYDGFHYDYHRNGHLVSKGNGNGELAETYNPKDFFKTGFNSKNSIRITHRVRNLRYYAGFKHHSKHGIIPFSKFKRNSVDAGLEYNHDRIKLSGDFVYSTVSGSFTGNSIFDYHLMRSIFLTPPTFDNANGLRKDAAKSNDTWKTESGEQRSAAIGTIDNPYWLINNSFDHINSNRFTAKVTSNYRLLRSTDWFLNAGFDKQSNRTETAIMAESFVFPEGKRTDRRDGISEGNITTGLTYFWRTWYALELNIITSYSFTYTKTNLNRQNSFLSFYNVNDGSPRQTDSKTNYRNQHYLLTKLNANYRGIGLLSLQGSKSWYSDIREASGFWGGAIAGGFKFSEIEGFRSVVGFINFGKLILSYGKTINDPPLIIDPDQYSSLTVSETELDTYFPGREVSIPLDLKTEKIDDLNIGLELGLFYNRFRINFSYYDKSIRDAVLPVASGEEIVADNLASLNTNGIDLDIENTISAGRGSLVSNLTFSKYRTIVTGLNKGYSSIPIAGFSFVSSNAIVNEPLGVFIGSKFLRNEEGVLIIGDDGYPLTDSIPGIVGNPNPDWIANLELTYQYKGFEIGFLFEYKHGGEVWNGTRNTLNYYGLSEETGKLRNTQNYIYGGVKIDGSKNDIPVDFASSELALEDIRWVRYGLTGVAEDAIEDASWWRIREFRISYDLPQSLFNGVDISGVRLSFIAHNIICISKYTGVDPDSGLLGNPGGIGLDYFNLPATRSYGIQLQIEF